MIDTINQSKNLKFRFDHVMIRVLDLDRALVFYRDILGMKVLRHTDYPDGQFTNVFLSFNEQSESSLELTYNWDREEPYSSGENFGHLALIVDDVHQAVYYLADKGVVIKTAPKIMAYGKRLIAFILDSDGNSIELIQPIDSF